MKRKAWSAVSLLLWSLAFAFAQTPSELNAGIEKLLSAPWIKYGYCGVMARSLENGETLYAREAERMMIPASNTKLITSAAAISILGPDYRYKTQVLAIGGLKSGDALEGDLILQGGGDPVLSWQDLKTLALQVKQAGISAINGIYYDDTFLDAERYGFGWNIDDESYGYQAQISGLSVERNALTLFVSPGAKEEDPVKIRLNPPTDYVILHNSARTGAANTPRTVSVTRWRAVNWIEITGSLPLTAGEVSMGRFSVENPSRFAATLFRDALRSAGVTVKRNQPMALLFTPPKPRVIAEHVSPPMSEIIALLNKPSDNLIAETLIKTIGKEKRGVGSTSAGMAVVNQFLREAGLDMNAAQFVDGSGLSRMNMVSAENLTRLLEHMRRSPHYEVFKASLPVIGVDGTLGSRLRNTEIQGKVFAKTGSLYRVSSLSGYLTAKSGKQYVFSIMMNAFTTPTAEARTLQDQLVKLLYESL